MPNRRQIQVGMIHRAATQHSADNDSRHISNADKGKLTHKDTSDFRFHFNIVL